MDDGIPSFDPYDDGLPELEDVFGLPKMDDEEERLPSVSVSEFISEFNFHLDDYYEDTSVRGEVASFKISHDKWVFFDLKDEEYSLNCFLPIWQLRMPIEDGMKVVVRATPKLTNWGKFSLTVEEIIPIGEGSIKKSFELLKKKLEQEGLFDPLTKRYIPNNLDKIGVISSTQAAGYADFCKIISARWGGLDIQVAHTQVQGMGAADQIISAINYFNEHAEVEAIAIIRGGGSADDLAIFNDEALVRAIAGSRIPIITGIGHEVDESLADLAADVVGSTPSNVAELLTRDKRAEVSRLHQEIREVYNQVTQEIDFEKDGLSEKLSSMRRGIAVKLDNLYSEINSKRKILKSLNPDRILKQGYSIISGNLTEGNVVKITTFTEEAEAQIQKVVKRKPPERVEH